jgi:hypothetical protein
MTNRNAVFSPPQGLVQEFKIHTATYDASIGHAAGAMTNVSMKSGGNALHGTADFNDSRLRATPWLPTGFWQTLAPISPRRSAPQQSRAGSTGEAVSP